MSDLSIRIGAETGVDVAPHLWGLFFEDINNCLDGGLNAQLVRNGDFEFSVRDRPDWHALTGWQIEGDGSVTVRYEDPIHPHNGTYIRAVGPITLTNEGWDGVGTRVDERFRLSCAAWWVWGSGELGARITDSGRVLASGSTALPEGGWHSVELELVASDNGRGCLELSVPDGLTLELDVISLRPCDDDGQPRTFRPDLVQALSDLAPSFMRFPGGCVAHGLGLANMYNWKPSIGPRHEREQLSNFWGYHQSRQIGYFEYFELCETIGATPLPVLAAGVCCANTRGGPRAIPEGEMQQYVQDILDLIEFANGDADSTWGAVRAELGHPKPFDLRYLGVGNEDEINDAFRERYAQIEDAVKQAYPGVLVIGTAGPAPFGRDWQAGWDFARQRGIDIVDEHAYKTPRWFHQNVDRYDTYSRGESTVYFGEYAARTNSVRAALAEAAFMVGMERNSDVVRLASYAPLLARIGDTQWDPDLIFFDAERVLPSASYYVQQLFSRTRGDRVCEVTIAGVAPTAVTIPSDGNLRFRSPGATFDIGHLVVDGREAPAIHTEPSGDVVVAGVIDPNRCEISFEAARTAGTEGLAIQFGQDGTFLEFVMPYWTGLDTIFYNHVDGISEEDDGPVRWRSLSTGATVSVRISLEGARVRAWLDGELCHDYTRDLRAEHRVVGGAASRIVDGVTQFVVRLVNATDEPRSAVLRSESGGTLVGHGHVLAGAQPDDGKSYEKSPVTPEPASVASDGSIMLPPWSLMVLTLEEK